MAKRKSDDTADTPSSKVNGSVVCQHMSSIREAQRAHETEGSRVQSAHKAAKKAGLALDALKLAMKLVAMDPGDAVNLYKLAGVYAEARSPGLLSQQDLFGDLVHAMPEVLAQMDMREIEAAGYSAGKKGELGQHDHHHEQGTEAAQCWERGYRAGKGVRMAEEEAGDRVPAAMPARGKRGSKAAPAPLASEKASPAPKASSKSKGSRKKAAAAEEAAPEADPDENVRDVADEPAENEAESEHLTEAEEATDEYAMA